MYMPGLSPGNSMLPPLPNFPSTICCQPPSMTRVDFCQACDMFPVDMGIDVGPLQGRINECKRRYHREVWQILCDGAAQQREARDIGNKDDSNRVSQGKRNSWVKRKSQVKNDSQVRRDSQVKRSSQVKISGKRKSSFGSFGHSKGFVIPADDENNEAQPPRSRKSAVQADDPAQLKKSVKKKTGDGNEEDDDDDDDDDEEDDEDEDGSEEDEDSESGTVDQNDGKKRSSRKSILKDGKSPRSVVIFNNGLENDGVMSATPTDGGRKSMVPGGDRKSLRRNSDFKLPTSGTDRKSQRRNSDFKFPPSGTDRKSQSRNTQLKFPTKGTDRKTQLGYSDRKFTPGDDRKSRASNVGQSGSKTPNRRKSNASSGRRKSKNNALMSSEEEIPRSRKSKVIQTSTNATPSSDEAKARYEWKSRGRRGNRSVSFSEINWVPIEEQLKKLGTNMINEHNSGIDERRKNKGMTASTNFSTATSISTKEATPLENKSSSVTTSSRRTKSSRNLPAQTLEFSLLADPAMPELLNACGDNTFKTTTLSTTATAPHSQYVSMDSSFVPLRCGDWTKSKDCSSNCDHSSLSQRALCPRYSPSRQRWLERVGFVGEGSR